MTGCRAAPLLATDLDRTLIYSAAAAEVPVERLGQVAVPVERYRDADISFLPAAAAAELVRLAAVADVVPVTTRTFAQYRRIVLPGVRSRWAVTTNGATVLTDGVPDPTWARRVTIALSTVAAVAEVRRHVEATCRPDWTTAVRDADGMFCYAVIDPIQLPASFVAGECAWAADRGWQVSLQGRKVYWVPRPLTKAAAVAEIARRTGAERVCAAGDSLLDRELLDSADAGILPAHGELAATGWRARHVRVTRATGLAAGLEVVRWFARQAAGIAEPAVTTGAKIPANEGTHP